LEFWKIQDGVDIYETTVKILIFFKSQKGHRLQWFIQLRAQDLR